MPYTVKTEGMDELDRMLRALGEKAEGIASGALYEGAGIMADEMEKDAESIRTAPFQYAANGKTRLPSPEEKAVVNGAGKIGIAKFRKEDGDVNTSVGYGTSGYAEMAGKTVPIPLIAASINSGTSFMQRQPFVRKASNRGGKRAMETITETIEKKFEELINENGG